MFGRRKRSRENAILREALAWYADAANWRKRGTNPKGTTPRTWVKSGAAFDRGARAKLVLGESDTVPAAWRMPVTVPAPAVASTAKPGHLYEIPAPQPLRDDVE